MNFTKSAESNIGNIKQPPYDRIGPEKIYYLVFDDDIYVDDVVLNIFKR